MAHKSSSISSGGSSDSPSPEPASTNTSPSSQSARAFSMVPMARERERESSRAASRPTINTMVPGGCWTCRLRRKKCDEQWSSGEDGCATCTRLGIDCLGGSTRPAWMRDKAAVEGYKAEIKAQLTRAGLIRGQPRTSPSTPDPSSPASHRFSPISTGNSSRPRPAARRQSSDSYRRDSDAPYPSTRTRHSSTNTANRRLPHSPTQDPHPHQPSMEPESPKTTQESPETEHALYYFQHVRCPQYPFAASPVTNITYGLIVQDPQGAVTNAVCSLASLHYNRTRIAQGLATPDSNPNESMARTFSDRALVELAKAQGHYSESDAVAALHLVSLSVLSGGSHGDWEQALSVALGWLSQTGLVEAQDPHPILVEMRPAAHIALKTTMWIDIFSSITLQRPPKFLSLYKRVYASELGYWSTHMNEDAVHMRTENICGVPEDILIAIGEISHLAYWKTGELHRGTLSVRELAHRGDAIEQRLRASSASPYLPPVDANGTPSFPGDDARRLCVNIFQEAAILYLNSTISNSNPGVHEIRESVSTIIRMVSQLPVSDVDRALSFPIAIAGSLTDTPEERELIRGRLLAVDSVVGNSLQINMLLEAVWERRDSRRPVDWRDMIRERLGMSLLFV